VAAGSAGEYKDSQTPIKAPERQQRIRFAGSRAAGPPGRGTGRSTGSGQGRTVWPGPLLSANPAPGQELLDRERHWQALVEREALSTV
jgi:hypothetical protein